MSGDGGRRLRFRTPRGQALLARVQREIARLARRTRWGPGRKILSGVLLALFVIVHPSAATRRCRALISVLRWQAHRAASRRPLRCHLSTGEVIELPPWSRSATGIAALGIVEPEQAMLANVLQPVDLFIDVGANIGLYTVPATASGCRVIAFEPDDQARKQLEHNVSLNGGKARIESSAVGDTSGFAGFTTGLDIANHFTSAGEDQAATRTVEVVVLKIDAEGYDLNVLRGARRLLHSRRCLVTTEVWDGGRDAIDELRGHDMRPYRFDLEHMRLRSTPSDFRGEGNLVFANGETKLIADRRLSESHRPLFAPIVHW